ncbi:hypothetical protein JZ751_002317 [Albula glossodonta]|uniref:Uncharacterized protein n=1 Tax=Albula glossodonta TaxID=121402 RepID=A0A8T2PBI7_9TELE|nr:hypothetical protein JZ751_002317 [Albula glossodonta]
MSRIPMGKVLLRNVIRHTDAHNKIQEESEMWKLRDMERQAVGDQVVLHRRKSTQNHRGKMHCDRFLEDTPASTQNRGDEREARHWTRKLYDFEASNPNSEKECSDGENLQLRKKRCKTDSRGERHKHSKKSSHKKKKKKEKKKRKAEEQEEEEGGRSGRSSSSERSNGKRHRRQRKSGKSKHKRKKKERAKGRKEESSSQNSDSDDEKERRVRRPRKRHRKAGSDSESHAQEEPHRKKRKDWKATNEENSEESSED